MKYLDKGVGRKVYRLKNGKVLKVSYNDVGIYQNHNEIIVANKSSILNNVYDYCKNYTWLICDYVEPAADRILKNNVDVVLMNWFIRYHLLINHSHIKQAYTEEEILAVYNTLPDDLKSYLTDDYITNEAYHLIVNRYIDFDALRLRNIGYDKNGIFKILDYGSVLKVI